MGWNWVNDLLGMEGKKKDFNWDARCPYGLCPGNEPLNRKEVILLNAEPILRKSKLKFIYKVSPFVYNYQCGYCGCGVNINIEVPDDRGGMMELNPLLYRR